MMPRKPTTTNTASCMGIRQGCAMRHAMVRNNAVRPYYPQLRGRVRVAAMFHTPATLLRFDAERLQCQHCGDLFREKADDPKLSCWALRYVAGMEQLGVEPGEWDWDGKGRGGTLRSNRDET